MAERSRYCQQEAFPYIGPKGQGKISKGRVLVAGCGALGSAAAMLLARAGVGFLRLVDKDLLELHNLHRQILYDEGDLSSGLPKAVLAKRHLEMINSTVEVEAVVAEMGPDNICSLVQDVDLVVDCLDNLPGRYLINEISIRAGKPWVHGGAVGARGNVMAFMPRKPPCFRCIFPGQGEGFEVLTCESGGILGPTATLIGSLEAMEALKLLTGAFDYLLPGMLTVDLWEGIFRVVDVSRAVRKDCPCCGVSAGKRRGDGDSEKGQGP